MPVRDQYPEEKLPYKIEHDDLLKPRCAQLFALIKKQMINVFEHDTKTFDNELQNFLQSVYNDGYNKGISDMNKMIKAEENNED